MANKRCEINRGERREEDTAGKKLRKKEIIFPTWNLCRSDDHILHKFDSFITCSFSGFCYCETIKDIQQTFHPLKSFSNISNKD
jgi:hypothetical protein